MPLFPDEVYQEIKTQNHKENGPMSATYMYIGIPITDRKLGGTYNERLNFG